MPVPSRPPPPRPARLAGAMALAVLGLAGAAAAQSWNAAQRSQVDVFLARTGLPRAWVASVKPGLVVAIRDRDGLAARAPGEKIRLHGEVVDEEAADRLGYKSMRSAVEVNCETRRDRVVEMEVFASPNLKGEAQARKLPGGWVQPSQDAYMADVIRAVCRDTPRLEVAREDAPPPKAPPVQTKPPPAPKPAPLPVAAPPAPVPRPAAALPPRPPSPDGPIATGPRSPRLLVAATEAAPPAAAPDPAPPPPRPVAVKPPPLKPAAAPGGGAVAQVGAFSSEANARRALSGLSPLMGGGLGTRIQTATVDGQTFYRAFVTGFASRTEASAFCAKVTAKGGSCLVR